MISLKSTGIASVIASAVALTGAVLPAQAATAPAWHQVFSHYYGPAANDYSSFTSVVAFGTNNVWALGGSDLSGGNGTTPQVVATQWNGTRWSGNQAPAGLKSYVFAASASSASNIWAVTFYGGYVLRYDGHTWKVAKRLPTGGLLTGVTSFAANNVWVFGTTGYGPGDGTWHYNGITWTHVTSKYATVGGVSAVNASDMWGLASVNAPGDTLVHFNGTAWAPASTKGIPTGVHIGDLHAISDKNIWASGSAYTNNSNIPYLLHFNGTTWTAGTLPWALASGDSSDLSSPTSDGAGGLWFIENFFHNGPGNAFVRRYYLVHRSATGSWGRIQTGSEIDAPSGTGGTLTDTVSGASLGDLTLIPGTKYLVGVGMARSKTDTSSSAVVWAYGSI